VLALAGFAVLVAVLMVAGRWIYRPRLPRDTSAFTDTEVDRSAAAASGRRHLVVLFRGIGGRPLGDVRAAIRETFPGADILAPRYSDAALSNENPLDIVAMYLQTIDGAVGASSYDRITFVGYSLGALLARKTLVCAHTGCRGDYFDQSRRDWRSRVDRLVLLAGMNRGWATSCEKVVAVEQAQGVGYDNDCRASYLTWRQWIQAEWGRRFGPTFGVGRLILAVQRGQPFVANLRLEWLALEATATLPPVVQLLGKIDELVSRHDNLDQFVTSRFAFIQLHGNTDHSNVVEMTGREGAERRARFVEALTWPIEKLKATYPQPEADPGFRPNPDIKRVVLILHGIRDDGRWARALANKFEMADPALRAYFRSYGYFAALHFLMPSRMEANVRWFVDQYTELRALYPQAEFHFVGHSNGTYMLAQSLAQYHAVTFGKVVFAGSVVQTGFPWSEYKGRLRAIRNYRASADLVVAALPSVFEKLRLFLRVGGAGHAGFVDDFARQEESEHLAKGGHGSVFEHQENYDALVNYVLDRSDCPRPTPCEAYELRVRTDEQSVLVDLVYKLSLFVWLIGILIVGALAYAAARLARGDTSQHGRLGHVLRSAAAGIGVVGLVLAVLRYI
jgi:pimeloyl-ACP methyl ester carboxylesterase